MITVIMMVDHEEKQVLPSGGRVRFCVIAVESPDTYQGSAQGRVVFPKTSGLFVKPSAGIQVTIRLSASETVFKF